jgi:cell division septation protein DedD
MFSEAPADAPQPPRPEVSRAATPDPPRARELVSCISIGPISNPVDAGDVTQALSSSGFMANQRTAEGDVWLGHWVFIDAIATQEEATEIVDRLADNGIDEAYVIADGNNGNLVSLGVFSEEQRAQQRLAEAEALGYTPVVADRSQPGDVYWLDVTAPGDAAFPISALPALNFGSSVNFEECEASQGG